MDDDCTTSYIINSLVIALKICVPSYIIFVLYNLLKK